MDGSCSLWLFWNNGVSETQVTNGYCRIVFISFRSQINSLLLFFRSYEAKVAFLETENTHPLQKRHGKAICRTNCFICKEASTSGRHSKDEIRDNTKAVCDPKWAWSKGRFLSVGAAVISCRNERAPDGLVADAHLSDGFLHLLLIRDCPLPLYLW